MNCFYSTPIACRATKNAEGGLCAASPEFYYSHGRPITGVPSVILLLCKALLRQLQHPAACMQSVMDITMHMSLRQKERQNPTGCSLPEQISQGSMHCFDAVICYVCKDGCVQDP